MTIGKSFVLRALVLIVLAGGILAATCSTAFAATGDTGTDGAFGWTGLADGTVALTSYSGSGGAVEIPATLSGMTVSAIGGWTFSFCTSLTSVTIPDGVTSIGGGAFYNCPVLASVTIPDSVTSIGELAFVTCESLTAVTLPAGVTSIGDGTFGGCTSLAAVTLPSGLTSIGNDAFWSCKSLTSATLPHGVTSIGNTAFAWCTSLTVVTIPAGVTSIGNAAFEFCNSLTAVTIPAGVTSIGNDAFTMDSGQGRNFDGWYTAPHGGSKFSFTTPVTADITIWARWYAAIAADTNNGAWGWVSGARTYAFDATATLTAQPATGYTFVSWTEGSSVVSTRAVYVFTASTGRVLVANFAPVVVPTLSAESSGYTSTRLSWTVVAGAVKYELWRATSSRGGYTRISSMTGTTFTNSRLTTGRTYYYKVRAYGAPGEPTKYSNYSAVKSARPVPSTPTAKVGSASYSSLKVSWASVPGASAYQVYRATSLTGAYARIKTTTSRSLTDAGRTTGKAYYYKVRAYRQQGKNKVYGSYSGVRSAAPVLGKAAGLRLATAASTSIKTSWSTVSGATGYEVWRATSSDDTYALIKTTTSRSWTNSGLLLGTTYYYEVRAYRLVGTTKVYGAYSTPVSMAL